MSNGLEQFGRDLRSYLKTVPQVLGRAVMQESADNFRRQGYENDAGVVVPWAPRKVVAKRKGRTNPRQRAILVKSGRLRRSVRIVAATATSVTVGSSETYAEPQQDGNTRGLQARPFITLGPSARNKLIKKISAGITGLVGR